MDIDIKELIKAATENLNLKDFYKYFLKILHTSLEDQD